MSHQAICCRFLKQVPMSSGKTGRSFLGFFRKQVPETPPTRVSPGRSFLSFFRRRQVPATSPSGVLPFHKIPGPIRLPVAGSFWVFNRIIGRYRIDKQHLARIDLQRRYGDIVKMDIKKNLAMILLYKPEDIEKVYKTINDTTTAPQRIPLECLASVRKDLNNLFPNPGILNMNGAEWRELRVEFNDPLKNVHKLRPFVPRSDEVALDFVKLVQQNNGSLNDALSYLKKWAFESICFLTLNRRMGCLDKNFSNTSDMARLIQATDDTIETVGRMLASPSNLWRLFPTANYRKLKEAQRFSAVTVRKYVDETIQALSKQKSEDAKSFLEAYLANEKLTKDEIAVMVLELLMGGIDTTAISAFNVLYLLALNPDVQDTLAQELKTVIPDGSTLITSEIRNQLKYLSVCIREMHRYRPVVGLTSRCSGEDIELSGYNVPAGTLLLGVQHVPCMDPRYVKNPTAFDPSRWMSRETRPDPFVTNTFGTGIRSCIGSMVADIELTVILARLIRKYEVQYTGEPVDVITELANSPDKVVNFIFKERS